MGSRAIMMTALVGLALVALHGVQALDSCAGGPPQDNLGSVTFPTSGSPEAQRHFLRGVGAMHSFWYEEALDAFRAATAAQPDFLMGYWGEAMTYNHPVWREQDTEAARAALAKAKDTSALTPREQAYLRAVQVLYGEGDKAARDQSYALVMEQLYRDYPEDLEAACFYALALLGTVPPVDAGDRRGIRAGAITLEVFRKNPNHPCGAHYTIHAFDHPDLAILALPAARRYAEIAPAAHHAQHMPAHIFVQLGMWSEAAARNEAGWANSVKWVERKGLALNHRDYHSLHWLLYVYLQQGRYRKAAEALALKQADLRSAARRKPAKAPAPGWEVHRFYPDMAAAWVVETEQWDAVSALWDVPDAIPNDSAKAVSLFVRGLASAARGRSDAEPMLVALQALRKPDADPRDNRSAEVFDVWALELRAAIEAAGHQYDQAVATMKEAVALEEALPPPSGPPAVIKPTHEQFGEILLRAGRPKEAAQQFAVSLERHPKRARSLLGAARAATQSGDPQGAAKLYALLRELWVQADQDLAEWQEIRVGEQ